MSDDRIERRYCAIIQLAKSSSITRVAESVPLLLDMIERWSNKDYEQLCRANDGQLFGFLFKSKKPARMLSAEFESCAGSQHGDTFIVLKSGTNAQARRAFSVRSRGFSIVRVCGKCRSLPSRPTSSIAPDCGKIIGPHKGWFGPECFCGREPESGSALRGAHGAGSGTRGQT